MTADHRANLPLAERLRTRLGTDLDPQTLVLAISRIPYGRPVELSAEGVLEEWTGTCSTKHLLFREVVREVWPELEPMLWHRPNRVTRELAAARWGEVAARAVPAEGLVDVHTFATVAIDGRRVVVDVTFPIEAWDGRSDIALACGDGEDHPTGDDVLATKAALVARHCDPTVREPFIAALSSV